MTTNIWSIDERPEALVKGFIIKDFKRYVVETFGQSVLDDYFASLTDAERATIDKDIFITEKVPLHLYYQGYAYLVDRFYDGEASKAIQLCKDMTIMNLNSFFKVMLKFYSTQRLINSLPRVWRIYTETGTLHVNYLNDDEFQLSFTEFPFSSEIFGNLFMGGVFAFVEHNSDVRCTMKSIDLVGPYELTVTVGLAYV